MCNALNVLCIRRWAGRRLGGGWTGGSPILWPDTLRRPGQCDAARDLHDAFDHPRHFYAVVARTGWPVATVSAAVTVHFLVGAGEVANLPRLYRHFGVPTVTAAALLAVGIAGWAFAAQPWQLFLVALASGAGWVAMGAAAVNALVAPWFNLRRPPRHGL